ncbi:hypothetical protein P168DRAFT_86569 [Aspergillus campestris IBT 28561]|uniref:Uncharacterized protein n=1 Tax=Aspergillus campestris (strain IBT 28561) TaxID=1392248 RepID=A0A2I1DAY4_ASPC2|nr:uncharacterized protein P168DRAFT_86569 [Aspergillus campestris IBT 28561]PKY07033.1 hypothetical protein P168DRAFT_86569 [Aspergillus campestris IBT 28561]
MSGWTAAVQSEGTGSTGGQTECQRIEWMDRLRCDGDRRRRRERESRRREENKRKIERRECKSDQEEGRSQERARAREMGSINDGVQVEETSI